MIITANVTVSSESNLHRELQCFFVEAWQCARMSECNNTHLRVRRGNGVSTARGKAPSASSIRYTSDVMSVPDQYMIRAGINYDVKAFSFSMGVRDECLPAKDLVGGNSGFRRPGYIISAEPGITYHFKKGSLYFYMPVALKRNRTQSEPDKIRTKITGVYAHGDAAFADYAINIGASFNF